MQAPRGLLIIYVSPLNHHDTLVYHFYSFFLQMKKLKFSIILSLLLGLVSWYSTSFPFMIIKENIRAPRENLQALYFQDSITWLTATVPLTWLLILFRLLISTCLYQKHGIVRWALWINLPLFAYIALKSLISLNGQNSWDILFEISNWRNMDGIPVLITGTAF